MCILCMYLEYIMIYYVVYITLEYCEINIEHIILTSNRDARGGVNINNNIIIPVHTVRANMKCRTLLLIRLSDSVYDIRYLV